MSASPASETLPAPLARALERRGYHTLTPVQTAVLDPKFEGRDLRISSRTGSGKTVALGLVLGRDLAVAREDDGERRHSAAPRALLVAPTRELAAQIGAELSWLYADLALRVCVVTGGTSVGKELRALSQDPSVVVGTPGRLCDHVSRGALDLSSAEMVVLDEADQMFDLGFREALEMLLGQLPDSCRKHLVSATFPRAVHALASRFQKDPAVIATHTSGGEHEDITHLAHLVNPRDRYAALVNVLLMAPDERTLVFVRTRANTSEVALRLAKDGFRAAALSGELAQEERTRTLEAFKAGALKVLVCTDVAARGIDVPDVTRVIHGDLPDNGEVLTHRSGRTGRAGNKGVSIMLVPENTAGFAEHLLRQAGILARLAPPPTPQDVQRAAQKRAFEQLTAAAAAAVVEASTDEVGELAGEEVVDTNDEDDEDDESDLIANRHAELATRLIDKLGAQGAVEALLAQSNYEGPCKAHPLTPVRPPRAPKPRFEPSSSRPFRKPFQKHGPAHHRFQRSRPN